MFGMIEETFQRVPGGSKFQEEFLGDSKGI
jgi:hypothetical protein